MSGIRYLSALPATDTDPASTEDGVIVRTIGTASIPGTGATNLGKAEDAGHTTGDVGVMSLAVRNDTPTALATTTLDYIPFTTTAYGGLWTTLVDNSGVVVDFSGITTVYRLLTSLATTNDINIKNAAGRYYWVRGYNNRATPVFIKMYNLATTPSVGTSTPIDTIQIPALSSFQLDYPAGVKMTTGIGLGISTAAADADTGAVAAGDVTCLSVGYA